MSCRWNVKICAIAIAMVLVSGTAEHTVSETVPGDDGATAFDHLALTSHHFARSINVVVAGWRNLENTRPNTTYRPPSDEAITLVTHGTSNRAPAFRGLCRSWQGPLSIAIFVRPWDPANASETSPAVNLTSTSSDRETRPSMNDVAVQAAFVRDYIIGNDTCLAYFADWHVVVLAPPLLDAVLRESPLAWPRSLADMSISYPFNILRNVALDGLATVAAAAAGTTAAARQRKPSDWVFLADADLEMWPADRARESRVRRVAISALSNVNSDVLTIGNGGGQPRWDPHRTAFVIPAVETTTRMTSDVSGWSLERLRTELKQKSACAFYGHFCRACHLPSNVERYADASDLPVDHPAARPYRVQYENGYEPYVIANRQFLPRYDERFIGRGGDKKSFFFELAQRGFGFLVSPKGPFLLHIGRGDTPAETSDALRHQRRDRAADYANFQREVLERLRAPLPSKAASLGKLPTAVYQDDVDVGATAQRPESLLVRLNPLLWKKGIAANCPGLDMTSYASSTLGETDVCLADLRNVERAEEDGEHDRVHKLERALSHACSIIDCRELNEGGSRHQPRSLVLKADWAFDRYYREALRNATPSSSSSAVASGDLLEEARRLACVFGGAARRARCVVGFEACLPRPNIDMPKMLTSLVWLCELSAAKMNCSDILMRACLIPAPYSSLKRLVHEVDINVVSSVLFTAYYYLTRCSTPNQQMLCDFKGSAGAAPWAELQAVMELDPYLSASASEEGSARADDL